MYPQPFVMPKDNSNKNPQKEVKWIGPTRHISPHQIPIEICYFKTIFTLDTVPQNAVMSISANARYNLYVNGQEILNGPCKGDHWHQYTDEINIAPYLNWGKNTVAVKVIAFPPYEANGQDRTNYGPFWNMANAAGPMLILHCDLPETNISTGCSDWYYLNDTAISWKMQGLTFWLGCAEDVDASKLPQGWECDLEIPNNFAPVITHHDTIVNYGEIMPMPLYHRPINYMLRLNKSLKFPQNDQVEIPPNTTEEILLDAKDMTTSFVYMPVEGGAGSTITMLYSEGFAKFDENGRSYKDVRSIPTASLPGMEDIFHPCGGEYTYSPSWFRTFRFLRLTITTKDQPLTIKNLRLTETRYPLANKVTFNAPQASWVKKVWDISLRTLQLCMHETYEDCPFYEQLQYTIDTRLQILFTYAISNDTELARKTIHEFHSSILPEGILQSRYPSKLPQVIPMFSLHWIFMLHDYYIETGDTQILERYRPTVESILAWYNRKTGPDNLVEYLPYWDFADWAPEWEDTRGVATASAHGPSTIQNLVYAYALRVGADIMGILGISVLCTRYQSEQGAILKSIEDLCWCKNRKMYKEGPKVNEYSQHAQMWAVLNNRSGGQHPWLFMEAILKDDRLIPCSFVMKYFFFRALDKTNKYEATEKLWSLWQDLLKLDLTTVPEIPGKYTRSDCHAWGALILHELPRKFLGVSPQTPGYETIYIQPKGLFLKELSGTVPTPKGDVKVSWSVEDGMFRLTGHTPIPATVELPNGEEYNVTGDFSYQCEV